MWYDLKKQQQQYFYLYSVLIYHSIELTPVFFSLFIATKNSEFYKWNESTSYRGQVNFKEFILFGNLHIF